MAKFKVHLETALKLIPHLVLRPQAFSVQSVQPLLVEIDHPDQDWVIDTINLLCRKDPTIKATQPTDRWGYWEDFGFPLTSPADLREGFEPTSNLNLWEDATHQITFDGGKHWTNVILEEGNPAYYVACSDGKRSWLVDNFSGHKDRVVKRPEPLSIHSTNDGLDEMRASQVYGGGRGGGKRIPIAFSDPVHQARYDRGACVECGNKVVDTPCRLCGSPGRIRQAATVGDTPACPMTDTCFDSDPSVVGE